MNPLIKKMRRHFPLTPDEEDALQSACSETYDVVAGQNIVHDGERPRNCRLLLSGTVCRYKQLKSGKRQILSLQFPGDIFDAQSFLLGVMDHSVLAMTNCRIGLIPHEVMTEITEDYPRLARAIWKDTLVDAAVFREWITNIGQRSSYGRIAHLMCEIYILSEAAGSASDGRAEWAMTQADLGDATGISQVHVNRILQELRAEGLISLKSKTLHILDFEGLKRAGEFDPEYLHLSPPQAHKDEPIAGVSAPLAEALG